jgi:hypothetical protein
MVQGKKIARMSWLGQSRSFGDCSRLSMILARKLGIIPSIDHISCLSYFPYLIVAPSLSDLTQCTHAFQPVAVQPASKRRDAKNAGGGQSLSSFKRSQDSK